MTLDYFWHWRPERSFPPETIVHPGEYDDSEHLNIFCTQTNLPANRQKRLIEEWCDMLPTLSKVRFLWFSSRINQTIFEAACQVPNLEGLYVKWSGIKSLAPLSAVAQLRYFHLGSSGQVTSIEQLGEQKDLCWLGLEYLSKIRDLSPLNQLVHLDGLYLQGTIDSTWKVNSLAPLGSLTNLRYLSIANLRSDDKTLVGLFPLSKLNTFQHANWWNHDELDEIRRRNPDLE